jgi:hypothetical protein
MKNIILFLFALVLGNAVLAQDEIKIAEDVLSYKADRLGNVYYVDSKNGLNKYEPTIKRYTRYADMRNGKITSIDVTNPLRIVVFYEGQSIAKFLDINLTEINSFDIRSNYSDGWISLVGSSNNNGLWMYDNVNRKIIKLGEQFNTQFSTGDLYLVLSKKINPSLLVENADELFLCDTSIGVFVFDLFGGYKRLLAKTTEDYFKIAQPNEHAKNYSVILRNRILYYLVSPKK